MEQNIRSKYSANPPEDGKHYIHLTEHHSKDIYATYCAIKHENWQYYVGHTITNNPQEASCPVCKALFKKFAWWVRE